MISCADFGDCFQKTFMMRHSESAILGNERAMGILAIWITIVIHCQKLQK